MIHTNSAKRASGTSRSGILFLRRSACSIMIKKRTSSSTFPSTCLCFPLPFFTSLVFLSLSAFDTFARLLRIWQWRVLNPPVKESHESFHLPVESDRFQLAHSSYYSTDKLVNWWHASRTTIWWDDVTVTRYVLDMSQHHHVSGQASSTTSLYPLYGLGEVCDRA